MDSKLSPTIIVPARLASVRFPKKLLADADGKPLILRTADRIRSQVPEFDLYFGVDGDELKNVLENSGYKVFLTNPALQSGTDRIAEVNQILEKKLVINVQADEPMVEREHILLLSNALSSDDVSISTLASPFLTKEDFLDPNQVKVVLDNSDHALYFSRTPIPYSRDQSFSRSEHAASFGLKHMGLYGYKKEFLEDFISSQPSELEKIEKLEQLRALQLGYRIVVKKTNKVSVGVDVPADLQKIHFS
ncbi:MAG: 3-deoxy-manno-octulosonate cytidylyltransferase [Opitutae bacterium]|nr:3-deoxy-manno-octulosonate cytidylyltransferase [Opitutae bacterium]